MNESQFRRFERLLWRMVLTLLFGIIGAGEAAGGKLDYAFIFWLAAILLCAMPAWTSPKS